MPVTTETNLTPSNGWQSILSGAGGVTMEAKSKNIKFAVTTSGTPAVVGHSLPEGEMVTWRTVTGETLYVAGDGPLTYTLEG